MSWVPKGPSPPPLSEKWSTSMKKDKRHGEPEESEEVKLNWSEDRNKNYRSGFLKLFVNHSLNSHKKI